MSADLRVFELGDRFRKGFRMFGGFDWASGVHRSVNWLGRRNNWKPIEPTFSGFLTPISYLFRVPYNDFLRSALGKVLGGSWVVISGVISPVIWVIIMVTPLISNYP